ncbi:hypothetical protein BB559_006188 [Furculomyces boomerangus]|uniref:Mannose-P-dolichol utilization defect 1 protein homolog n=2 Tax=Harpellales TaxID=61421 RepID=A0A2T9Y4D2_9FUNG|nr:hypothetical protein BB559_006188 [Furculomyces boomerangus]PWA02424.1 hypothetical protein BB558_001438 [Smittium angustum]
MSWLPNFLRNPIVLLLGENCTHTIVDELNIFDPVCFKYAVSKALGLGIVLGGCIVKLPQIMKILRSRSARGLSLSAFFLETIANIVTVAFNMREGYSFTTYGESLFIGIQNYFITITILLFSNMEWIGMVSAGLIMALGYLLYDPSMTSASTLSMLQALTIPIVISSRIPQIMKIHKEKSTGQLSAFSVFNYFIGTAARVYTTFVEVDNNIVLLGFVLSLVTNGILAGQMIYYWNSQEPKKQAKKQAKKTN